MNRVKAQSSLFCANFKLSMRYNGFAVMIKLFKDGRCVYKYAGSSHLKALRSLRRMPTAEADNTLLDLHNSSYHTKVEYNNCF